MGLRATKKPCSASLPSLYRPAYICRVKRSMKWIAKISSSPRSKPSLSAPEPTCLGPGRAAPRRCVRAERRRGEFAFLSNRNPARQGKNSTLSKQRVSRKDAKTQRKKRRGFVHCLILLLYSLLCVFASLREILLALQILDRDVAVGVNAQVGGDFQRCAYNL